MLKKLTPVLIVEAIEPCLPFWVERLGFEVTVKVPDDGDHLGFVILVCDDVEVMLQTQASVMKEEPDVAKGPFRSALFIEVERLAPIQKKLAGYDKVLIQQRETFYGAIESAVRGPAGNVITFAEFTNTDSTGESE